MENVDPELMERLARALVDKGLLIEAGWVGYKAMTMPKDASQWQINDTRTAFFAGATHLFFSVMGVLEPGAEPSDVDLQRMDKIDKELRAFQEKIKADWERKKQGNN